MYVSPTGNSKLHPQIITKDGSNKQKKSDFRNTVELSHSQDISNHDNMVLHYKKDYETAMAAGGSFVNGAYYTMYYTENSTEENPIVTAVGVDKTGKEFEFNISVNDIDPNNANFLEMMTLMTHRSKDFTADERCKLMAFMDTPEISMVEKVNYVNLMEGEAKKAQVAGFKDISQSYLILAAKFKNYFIQKMEEYTTDIFNI